MKTNIKEVNEHINNLNNEVTRLRDALELIANATGGDDARYYQYIAQTVLSEVAITVSSEELNK